MLLRWDKLGGGGLQGHGQGQRLMSIFVVNDYILSILGQNSGGLKKVWPKCLDNCPVWTAATGTNKANIKIFLCLENVQKFHSRPKLRGFEKRLGKMDKMPCTPQIAYDQTIVLRPESVQKVHSKPKIWSLKVLVPFRGTLPQILHSFRLPLQNRDLPPTEKSNWPKFFFAWKPMARAWL